MEGATEVSPSKKGKALVTFCRAKKKLQFRGKNPILSVGEEEPMSRVVYGKKGEKKKKAGLPRCPRGRGKLIKKEHYFQIEGVRGGGGRPGFSQGLKY